MAYALAGHQIAVNFHKAWAATTKPHNAAMLAVAGRATEAHVFNAQLKKLLAKPQVARMMRIRNMYVKLGIAL